MDQRSAREVPATEAAGVPQAAPAEGPAPVDEKAVLERVVPERVVPESLLPEVDGPPTGSLRMQRPPPMPPERAALLAAVERLRSEVSRAPLSFLVPGVEEARRRREVMLRRLDGYLLPRLRRMDAPLLVVIGGSTGAGKSTLTNSLVGVSVSPAGVLRPTTRSPVLVHNPRDAGAFLSRRILPGLVRTSMTGAESLEPDGARPDGAQTIRLVPHESVVAGLAIIDSPDLDSLVDANRELARQLFEVADLWLFVTSATDYADAVPWEMLTEARDRGLSVAVVMDRMRPSETDAVRMHFATMLHDRGLSGAPLITIPETMLVDGFLPPSLVTPLRRWLARQAEDARTRDGHLSRVVAGTLRQVLAGVPELVDAAVAQTAADGRLRVTVDECFDRAEEELLHRLSDGSALDETVQAAWHPIATAPESSLGVGRLRRRMSSAIRGEARYEAAGEVQRAALAALVRAGIEAAHARVARTWRDDPAVAFTGGQEELFRLPVDVGTRAQVLFRQWEARVQDALRSAGRLPHGPASSDPAVVAVAALVLGADGNWIGQAARSLLEIDGAVTDLPQRVGAARDDLRQGVVHLLGAERRRVTDLVDDGGAAGQGPGLRHAADEVRQALLAVEQLRRAP